MDKALKVAAMASHAQGVVAAVAVAVKAEVVANQQTSQATHHSKMAKAS